VIDYGEVPSSWVTPESALEITSVQDLLRFGMGTVTIGRQVYTVLTGLEGTGGCFWCGEELKGKLQRYCYGHMKLYYRHFEWGSAKAWCFERYGSRCANCGAAEAFHYSSSMTNLRAHHIVPLNGQDRAFSAFNLPWNLICLCHDCHMEVHAAMRPPPKRPPTGYEERIARGQLPFGIPWR